jgi:hypothetical protein
LARRRARGSRAASRASRNASRRPPPGGGSVAGFPSREPDRLQGEHPEVAEGAEGPVGEGAEPGLAGVLDQQQPPRPAPGQPGRGVLGEAQVVDEDEGPDTGPEQGLQLVGVGLQPGAEIVGPSHQARPGQCRRHRPVVPGRHQHLVPGAQAEGLDALEEGRTGIPEEPVAWFPEGERRDGGGTAQVAAHGQGGRDAQPAGRHQAGVTS